MPENDPVTQPKDSRKLTVRLDLRLIVVLLLVVIAAMLLVWRPWTPKISSQARTISVSGDATLTATPDEFIFSPEYQFKNADKQAALQSLTAKQIEVVAGVKKLGVADAKIKADANGYSNDYYYSKDDNAYIYNLGITVTVNNKDLAQKVQDYLIGTDPSGTISPVAQFSDATQKKLQVTARDTATKDARAKADQSAHNLGFKVGAVKSVDDGGFGSGGCGGVCPLAQGAALSTTDKATSSLSVQAGQNDLNYSVTVVYFIK